MSDIWLWVGECSNLGCPLDVGRGGVLLSLLPLSLVVFGKAGGVLQASGHEQYVFRVLLRVVRGSLNDLSSIHHLNVTHNTFIFAIVLEVGSIELMDPGGLVVGVDKETAFLSVDGHGSNIPVDLLCATRVHQFVVV